MTRRDDVIRATFPIDLQTIAVAFSNAENAGEALSGGIKLLSGRKAEVRGQHDDDPTVVLVEVDAVPAHDLAIDQVVACVGEEEIGPRFVHGIRSPMDLKVPYLELHFPYRSTLIGVHVSVSCCTGCNGGIHDRGLVVLNNHTGGSWSSIWVHTPRDLPADYARWQKVVFCGGVLRDVGGSTAVIDEGWMRIRLGGEEPHGAPTPARVSTHDFPVRGTRSLFARSLDACWVEFSDVTISAVDRIDGGGKSGLEQRARLPHVEVVFSDGSGGTSTALLYQESAFDLAVGDTFSGLRGFIHAESPGRYVLVSDKEEDLLRHETVIRLGSEDEVRYLLAHRPDRTRTYAVPREVFGQIALDTRRELREMNESETRELAEFLEVTVEDLDGPLMVVDARCPDCERHLTFLDFTKTALRSGRHDLVRLREILTGNKGAWITIRGLDGGRPVMCAQCGAIARLPNDYSEYSSSSYAYA